MILIHMLRITYATLQAPTSSPVKFLLSVGGYGNWTEQANCTRWAAIAYASIQSIVDTYSMDGDHDT